ncbi:MAG: hypothetical protein ACT4QD_19950 [Acidobacteriota bacterium]
MTLFSGADAVDLYYTGPAHTNGDTFVVFRRVRAMVAGDAFPGNMQPIIDVQNGGSGVSYPETLAKASAAVQGVEIVVPGHAPPTKWPDFLYYAEFNRMFLAHAREALKAGKTPVQAMEEFRAQLPPKFKDYTLGAGMMTGPGGNFEPIFRELQAR